MFDLIDESGADLERYGYTVKNLGKNDVTLGQMEVDSLYKSKKMGLGQGDYYIFSCPTLYQQNFDADAYLIKKISEKLRVLLEKLNIQKSDRILIIGLGNPDIDADKLGKVVFDNIQVDALSKNNNVFKICPNIFFSTGIETFDIVKMLVKELKIKCVLIVDSLTTSSLSRLGTSFQISSCGMTPGSGVNRFGKAINKKSVGAECISIGVPFMIFSTNINENISPEVILTPKDIKENVERVGFIIAKAIMGVI